MCMCLRPDRVANHRVANHLRPDRLAIFLGPNDVAVFVVDILRPDRIANHRTDQLQLQLRLYRLAMHVGATKPWGKHHAFVRAGTTSCGTHWCTQLLYPVPVLAALKQPQNSCQGVLNNNNNTAGNWRAYHESELLPNPEPAP